MQPSLLSQEIFNGLKSFITTGFETDTPYFKGIFSRFVETDGNLLKGPWLSMGLPFLQGKGGTDFFSTFNTSYPPYHHQQQAWERISSDHSGRSTLVATGTGSGKTECFLYPLLDHCARSEKKGIKAIVIYPMNALATDQAKRFAQEVFAAENLKGKVRVGLFVGGKEEQPVKEMSGQSVITDKDVLRDNPPDILLTNYKMLDFLLMRPKDRKLWRLNGADTLRYLVVDELHTFDGAQGTDLACLIRRLRGRVVGGDGDHLICVGTSATLGSGDGVAALTEYAESVFQSPFDQNSVIVEQRQSTDQFLSDPIQYLITPVDHLQQVVDPNRWDSLECWLEQLQPLFFTGETPLDLEKSAAPIELGRRLKRHLLFNNILRILSKTPLIALSQLVEAVENTLALELRPYTVPIVNAMIALVAVARSETGQPLVNLRVQLWLREMRRMVVPLRPVEINGKYLPMLGYADDLKQGEEDLALPVIQCNHCNATAWVTRIAEGESNINEDLRAIYQAWFSHDPESVVLLPLVTEETLPNDSGVERYLCLDCGHLQGGDGSCASCGEDQLQRVFRPYLLKQKKGKTNRVVSEHHCPVCEAQNAMMVFGARSATLSSVAIHHLYATRWNDDKKLITFSDSVQDASHRAGFFAARTWRNLIRSAIARAMTEEKMPLTSFYDWLPRYWLDSGINPQALSEVAFVARFIAPNMLWYREYVEMQSEGMHELPAGSRLIEDVSRRLQWEVLAEFGYRSTVGRSLEQVGLLVLGIDDDAIQNAVTALMTPLREHEGIHWVSEQEVGHFIAGLLLHMRQLGAIDHPFLRSYIEQGGRNYLFNQQTYLPSLAPGRSSPVFMTNAKSHASFEGVVRSKGDSWLVNWMKKTIGQNGLPVGFEKGFFPRLFSVLEEQSVVVAYESKGSSVWGLNPERLYLSDRSVVLETEQAKDRLFVDEELVALVNGMPSLLHTDHGDYQVVEKETNWLARAYQQGDLQRIYASEHTGLLERDERQRVEHDFMEGTDPWSCNLLSATPTLEMGIDIGDLSSLLLCSVPPAQANYLQRIGRAGRRDGNAFAMTVAEGAPHDLYFYEDPVMMMDGEVEPPGVYLNAFAVIARQLTAYCMDQWVDTGIDESAVPKRMKAVLDAVERGDHGQFPFNFIDYVEANQIVLFEGFVALFADELTEHSIARLKQFILDEGEEEGLRQRLISSLHVVRQEREGLVSKIKSLKNALDRLKRRPEDEVVLRELDDVEQERSGLMALLRQMNGKQPLNFLTDEGLIPNYAFPEAGVTLRSVIYRKKMNPKEGESAFENRVYEYERPGVSAIRELIPNSKFYAGERKVEIRQVDLDLSAIEQWRFCPSCSHAQQSLVQAEGDCPRCGDPMWADAGQLVEMTRLRQVMANSSDRDSRITDDSEDREPSFHVRQMLSDFESSAVSKAWRIKSDEFPFGFEFIRKATFREVNFGEYGANGEEVEIAGVSQVRPGFLLCRHCGMVQNARKISSGEGQEHSHTCKTGRQNPQDESNLIDCLYLYRDFESEALRILMPLSSLEDEGRSMNSFIAGLQLGLQLRFGGKVDHLRVMNYSEPSNEGGERHFLMIYDSVPGGTGYLQQLMEQPSLMLELFQLARDQMVGCGCNQDLSKDGCYRCLYAYRNSHGMESTSRDRSVELFDRILKQSDEIEELKTIDDIQVNPLLDSELERRFIAALRTVSIEGTEVQIHKQVVNNKPGWFLQVNGQSYTVEPQVDLGENDHVTLPSRPDFLIRAARSDAEFLPLALFLDGYQYHHAITAEDSAKRMAILCSGQFLIWSLSWDDVNDPSAKSRQKLGNPFNHELNDEMRKIVRPMSERLDIDDRFFKLPLKSPFEQMLHFLGDPDRNRWAGLAFVRSLYWFDQAKMTQAEWIESVKQRFESHIPTVMQSDFEVDGQVACADTDFAAVHFDLMVPLTAVSNVEPHQFRVMALLNDQLVEGEQLDQRSWHGWLMASNLFQFLPDFLMATSQGVGSAVYEALQLDKRGDRGIVQERGMSEEWKTALDLVDGDLVDGLTKVAELGVGVPEVGYEFTDNSTAVVAEAEIAWSEMKLAGMFLESAVEIEEITQGWSVIDLNSEDWIGQIRAYFEEE